MRAVLGYNTTKRIFKKGGRRGERGRKEEERKDGGREGRRKEGQRKEEGERLSH